MSLPLTALALFACGDNLKAEDDDGGAIDAARVDGAVVDGAVTDATVVDGAVIDGAVIDGAVVDGAVVDGAVVDGAIIDGAIVIDALNVDAGIVIDGPLMLDGPPGPAVGTHLLISEVKTVDGSEFIEIYNPTALTIDLRNYYLTDHNAYAQYPGFVAGNTMVTVDATDFLARFPVGAMIGPRQVITVATDAGLYETGLMSVPTYTIQEPGNSTPMELIWSGMTPNPGLTNAGEMVALFFWDGVTDNVKDVDLFIAGNAPTAANTFVAKPAVDGPDVDTVATPYVADAMTIQDMATDTPTLTSYKRIALETGNEVQMATGNGILGDDETTEQTRTTWDSQAVASGYTAATPGTVPAAINP